MNRAITFLVFGPALAAFTALLGMAQVGGVGDDFAKLIAIAVFFFTLPVSATTGCVDGVLHDVARPLRAALTATVGAIVAVSLAFLLLHWSSPPRYIFMFFAIGGAACMSVCSLLANDYGWQRTAVSTDG
jgi:hypothetical protein